jgi:hypothetical protein
MGNDDFNVHKRKNLFKKIIRKSYFCEDIQKKEGNLVREKSLNHNNKRI